MKSRAIINSTTTEASNKRILNDPRLENAVTLTLRDIIMKDLVTSTETGENCIKYNEKFNEMDRLNIYIDKFEFESNVTFNLSINNDPAFRSASEFEMFLVSGNYNEVGAKPYKICGIVKQTEPDTHVLFKIPFDDEQIIFSYHNNGFSYANYVIYAVLRSEYQPPNTLETSTNDFKTYSPRATNVPIDNRPRALICKGKIYRTDILYDLTESVLDGQ